MPIENVFRVNYYVGALLAQGGNLKLADSKIVFSPTSSLDRAMGAVDVEIPFQKIIGTEVKGTLSRSVHIKTTEKTHRFEGSQTQKFWDVLQKMLSVYAVVVPTNGKSNGASGTASAENSLAKLCCHHCSRPIQPGYFFCPHCAQRLKSVCLSCHKSVDPTWTACPFCGWKTATTSRQHKID